MYKDAKALKQSDLKKLRERALPKRCPICNRELTMENSVVDHIHSQHKTLYPETHSLVRDVICSSCNIIIGKIENIYLRCPKDYKEETNLPDILKNISEYIKKYSKIENFDSLYIHPKEVKTKKIKKSWFNKLKKQVKETYGKDLEYPKSGRLIKEIEKYALKLGFEINEDIYY